MYAPDHALIATPIGMIRVEGDETSLSALRIGSSGMARRGSTPAVRAAVEQIEAYFASDLKDFDVALQGVRSPRGAELRNGLIGVGYGDTVSYGELARRLDSGPRAIGQLCARNPFPIIVPCHRVIGAGGILGSYSGGDGRVTKQWLLDHERQHL